MTRRKLLSGESITRLEKKLLSNMEGRSLRGRRKFKSTGGGSSSFLSGLRIGDMYRDPELEIKQLGNRFYRHASDLHVGEDTVIPVYSQLLDSPPQSALAVKQTGCSAIRTPTTDLLIQQIEKEVHRVWDEITRSPNPPDFNSWGYVVTVDIKTGKENG